METNLRKLVGGSTLPGWLSQSVDRIAPCSRNSRRRYRLAFRPAEDESILTGLPEPQGHTLLKLTLPVSLKGSTVLGSYQNGSTDDREGDFSDFEDSGDEHDASATANWAKGGHWCEDVEEENEHGGDILDEPHDGRDDDEPWLGWANATGQTGIDVESVQEVKDSPDYGGAGNFTGEGCDQARDLLRSRRHRLRPEPSLTIVGPAFPLFAR